MAEVVGGAEVDTDAVMKRSVARPSAGGVDEQLVDDLVAQARMSGLQLTGRLLVLLAVPHRMLDADNLAAFIKVHGRHDPAEVVGLLAIAVQRLARRTRRCRHRRVAHAARSSAAHTVSRSAATNAPTEFRASSSPRRFPTPGENGKHGRVGPAVHPASAHGWPGLRGPAGAGPLRVAATA
jgi:hypothetical protein